VRAFVQLPEDGASFTRIWAEKADGTPVLTGTAANLLRDARGRAVEAFEPGMILYRRGAASLPPSMPIHPTGNMVFPHGPR
jgi:hypothetical protein